VSVALGTRTTAENLSTDWVLTHEFVHLATPTLRRRDAWFMEGAATYLEPLARARVGLLDADALWQGLLEGLPAGLPRADDTGLDGTRAWGRKYWGGALYFLLADLEIRERSGGRRSLDDAFRGILAEGGDVRANWTLEEALAAGDRGVGGGWNVLSRLHAAQGPTAVPPDLDALFRRFGVSRAGGRVVFDDSAPLAAVRRALTTGAREKGDAPAKKAP
jgi:predicted metalloprotease with PDZ domain